MLFKYEATTPRGESKVGDIEASNRDIAIASLQRRGLIVIFLEETDHSSSFWKKNLGFFERIKPRDIVILSRQLSTLFEAKVPVLTSIQLLAKETENLALRSKITEILDDIQGGTSISEAMAKHPDVFSKFFVSMVRSGEESGKLDEVFSYLADYLERNYELTSKAKSALIYPLFVLSAFIGVMILMLVVIIPKLGVILKDTGQELPIYTKIVLSFSNFLANYGIFILGMLVIIIGVLWYYHRTKQGKLAFARFQLSVPYIGTLYKKIYLSRMMDNLETLFSAGIPAARTLELTSDVIDNEVFKQIVVESVNSVRAGSSISESLSRFEDIPSLIIQMMKVGEETGKLAFVLKMVSRFYRREVDNSIQTLMSLIEPALIVVLGLGVGILIAAVLGPIYNISSGI